MSAVATDLLTQIVALDALTLRTHTEQAGDVFSLEQQRANLRSALANGHLCHVNQAQELAAYAVLRPIDAQTWFVGAFSTHPHYRNAAVLKALFCQVGQLLQRHQVQQLQSHVYKTNRLSLAFHRKLGFVVTQENAKAFAFQVATADLLKQAIFLRLRPTSHD